jgi:hypothetical protein
MVQTSSWKIKKNFVFLIRKESWNWIFLYAHTRCYSIKHSFLNELVSNRGLAFYKRAFCMFYSLHSIFSNAWMCKWRKKYLRVKMSMWESMKSLLPHRACGKYLWKTWKHAHERKISMIKRIFRKLHFVVIRMFLGAKIKKLKFCFTYKFI